MMSSTTSAAAPGPIATTSAGSSSSGSTTALFLTSSPLAALASKLYTLLKARSQTVGVAETATGGLVSAALLALPGASAVYRGGVVVYSLDSRVALAGWTAEDVKAYRGPSEAVVAGLARGVRERLGADWVICESGTAGPTGGSTKNRTPGYVALAVAGENGTVTRELDTGLGGDRTGNMVAFAAEALKLTINVVEGDAKL